MIDKQTRAMQSNQRLVAFTGGRLATAAMLLLLAIVILIVAPLLIGRS